MRVLDIYHFLRFKPAGKEILKIMPSSHEELVKLYITTKQQQSLDYTVRSPRSELYFLMRFF